MLIFCIDDCICVCQCQTHSQSICFVLCNIPSTSQCHFNIKYLLWYFVLLHRFRMHTHPAKIENYDWNKRCGRSRVNGKRKILHLIWLFDRYFCWFQYHKQIITIHHNGHPHTHSLTQEFKYKFITIWQLNQNVSCSLDASLSNDFIKINWMKFNKSTNCTECVHHTNE